MQNESLSVLNLILEASIPVQLVMLILLLASMISWVMIIQRGRYQSRVDRQSNRFEEKFWSGGDLTQLYRAGNAKAGSTIEGLESIFRAGFKEFSRLTHEDSRADPDAVMEGTTRAMRAAHAREEEKLENSLSFLASVASVSPYIGLLGTVWGIMNSFLGLATQNQATLASVAPGIAEALIATAMGLFAAIPAVLAYNRFVARADKLSASFTTFADEFSSLLHRQVHAG